VSTVEIGLVSLDAELAIGDEKDPIEMMRKAFAAAKGHWMVLDRDKQFKGALNAVLQKLGSGTPAFERLTEEIKLIGQFNAFIQANQAGLSVDIPEVPEGLEPFGVMKIWGEVTKEAA
jgi:hypothetical protein